MEGPARVLLLDLLDTDGLEGGIADVVGDFDNPHSLVTELGENWSGEVEAGGRGGNRSALAGVDRLVAGFVEPLCWAGIAFNVGGKRGLSNSIDDGVEGDVRLEPEETSAIGKNLEHLRA